LPSNILKPSVERVWTKHLNKRRPHATARHNRAIFLEVVEESRQHAGSRSPERRRCRVREAANACSPPSCRKSKPPKRKIVIPRVAPKRRNRNVKDALVNAICDSERIRRVASLAPPGELMLQAKVEARPQGLFVSAAELVYNLIKDAQHLRALALQKCTHIPTVTDRDAIDLHAMMFYSVIIYKNTSRNISNKLRERHAISWTALISSYGCRRGIEGALILSKLKPCVVKQSDFELTNRRKHFFRSPHNVDVVHACTGKPPRKTNLSVQAKKLGLNSNAEAGGRLNATLLHPLLAVEVCARQIIPSS
jgi:hypothetical protein